MADVTNGEKANAGGQLSGEATRNAAIKKLQQRQKSENYDATKHVGTMGPPMMVPIPVSK